MRIGSESRRAPTFRGVSWRSAASVFRGIHSALRAQGRFRASPARYAPSASHARIASASARWQPAALRVQGRGQAPSLNASVTSLSVVVTFKRTRIGPGDFMFPCCRTSRGTSSHGRLIPRRTPTTDDPYIAPTTCSALTWVRQRRSIVVIEQHVASPPLGNDGVSLDRKMLKATCEDGSQSGQAPGPFASSDPSLTSSLTAAPPSTTLLSRGRGAASIAAASSDAALVAGASSRVMSRFPAAPRSADLERSPFSTA